MRAAWRDLAELSVVASTSDAVWNRQTAPRRSWAGGRMTSIDLVDRFFLSPGRRSGTQRLAFGSDVTTGDFVSRKTRNVANVSTHQRFELFVPTDQAFI